MKTYILIENKIFGDYMYYASMQLQGYAWPKFHFSRTKVSKKQQRKIA